MGVEVDDDTADQPVAPLRVAEVLVQRQIVGQSRVVAGEVGQEAVADARCARVGRTAAGGLEWVSGGRS
jgi:hypothetical protein